MNLVAITPRPLLGIGSTRRKLTREAEERQEEVNFPFSQEQEEGERERVLRMRRDCGRDVI